ncbi:alpha/beta hydrolase [Anaeromyxobacter terrae]|uniref:alpha/beta hydrolase n=1 Tax=Anaeromyxobacter terrae TaxID=2925406 RepID=UPI001F5600F3|nr:alpha/beta hydrolase [Anaeromyxobacter sp. SG22]
MPVPSFPSEAEARHEEGFLNSADHLRLFWQRFTPPSPRATVVVLHGAGDHSGRYPAVTTALVRAGFQAALVDLRGHGQSDGQRWHVDSFGDYVADLDAFVAKLRADGVAGKLFVLAHSQGALVAAAWGLAHGRAVDGFVLSSPYFRLAFRPPAVKVLAAKLAGRVVPRLRMSAGLDVADLTSDLELQRWTDHDPLYGRATTPRWFAESTRAQAAVLRGAPRFEAPLLVLAAGADRIADVAAARAFVDAARSGDKRLVVYDGFRHEIFNEVERDRPIAEAIAWLTSHAK